MNFQTLLQHHVTTHPQRIAYYDETRPWSYGDLHQEVERIANVLHKHGATQGDRLALWMPNCIQWLTIFLGCARLGITVICINTRFREHEVGQLLVRGRCKWLAVWPEFKALPFASILGAIDPHILAQLQGVMGVGHLTLLRNTLPDLTIIPEDTPSGTHNLHALPPVADTTGAIVFTTSGTTSSPKLVLHRQSGLIAHGQSTASAFQISHDSVVLLAAPLCGTFGFSTAMSGLAVGATLVSSPVFCAAHTTRLMQELRVTHTFANNEFIDLLLREVPSQAQPFPCLQYVGFASFAPAMTDLPERARDAGIPIAGLYGSSELQALVAGQTLDAPWSQRRLAGGKLVAPEARVRTVDAQTGHVLAHGELGLLQIKAPSLMAEYLDHPQATSDAVDSEGYFHTGDLGISLNDREFIFQGRDGDYLRLGGFLVNPIEIESYIEQLEGVQACQVVGVEFQGRIVPVAFVIPHPGRDVSEQRMIQQCTASMARFKVPQRIIMVDQFPMTQSANSNKIQRAKLQQMAEEVLASTPHFI